LDVIEVMLRVRNIRRRSSKSCFFWYFHVGEVLIGNIPEIEASEMG
jgi:hypothetical protein